MATPDHKARARSSFPQDDYLTTLPDSSHSASPTERTRIDAAPATMTRLGDDRFARRWQGVLRAQRPRGTETDGSSWLHGRASGRVACELRMQRAGITD